MLLTMLNSISIEFQQKIHIDQATPILVDKKFFEISKKSSPILF